MTAGVSGRVWLDVNNNGRKDNGEIGIPGVDIVLSGTDLRGQPVIIVSMTDDNGVYQFDNLPAGTYTVDEIQPRALVDGVDRRGNIDGVASGIVANDKFSNLALRPGQRAVDFNFGERGLVKAPVSRRFVLASTPPLDKVIREVVARGEELAGDAARAEAIRRGLATEVRRIGSHVAFRGSELDDVFVYVPAGSVPSTSATNHLVIANGVRWEMAAQEIDAITIDGFDGDDVVELHDSPIDDLLTASQDTAIMSNGALRVEAVAAELVSARSGAGGMDSVREDAIDFVLQLEGSWNSSALSLPVGSSLQNLAAEGERAIMPSEMQVAASEKTQLAGGATLDIAATKQSPQLAASVEVATWPPQTTGDLRGGNSGASTSERQLRANSLVNVDPSPASMNSGRLFHRYRRALKW